MQIISSDRTSRIDTIEDLKEFNSKSVSTKAKRGMMPAIKKSF